MQPGDLCWIDLGGPSVPLVSLDRTQVGHRFTMVRDGEPALVLSLGPARIAGISDDCVCILILEGAAWIHPTLLHVCSHFSEAVG